MYCGATRHHTPLRTRCRHTIFLTLFVGTIPVALIYGDGAIAVIFLVFLLLFLLMVLLFIVGCIHRSWKGNPRPYLLSLLIGILVAAGFLCGLYAIGSRTKAWMSLGLVARVVMAPLSFLALLRIRILGQSDDPAGQEGAPEPEKSPPER